jgi:hypothetical protein
MTCGAVRIESGKLRDDRAVCSVIAETQAHVI